MRKKVLLMLVSVLVILASFLGCRQYYSQRQVSIPDNSEETAVSELNIPMHLQIIENLDVEIRIEHPDLSDLEAWIESPQGTTIPLFNDIRGTGLSGVIFDDEANYPIYAFDYPYGPWGGTFQIQEYDPRTTGLFLLDGENAGGTWKLYVHDRVTGNAGKITFFALCINGVW